MSRRSVTVKKVKSLRLLEKVTVHEPMRNSHAFKLYS